MLEFAELKHVHLFDLVELNSEAIKFRKRAQFVYRLDDVMIQVEYFKIVEAL
jgi:hypothetical protein